MAQEVEEEQEEHPRLRLARAQKQAEASAAAQKREARISPPEFIIMMGFAGFFDILSFFPGFNFFTAFGLFVFRTIFFFKGINTTWVNLLLGAGVVIEFIPGISILPAIMAFVWVGYIADRVGSKGLTSMLGEAGAAAVTKVVGSTSPTTAVGAGKAVGGAAGGAAPSPAASAPVAPAPAIPATGGLTGSASPVAQRPDEEYEEQREAA